MCLRHGESTLFCSHARKSKKARAAHLCDTRYLAHAMSVRGLAIETILPAGERLAVSFVTNLSANGALLGFLEPGEALRAWARRLYEGFPLAVMGLDVFSASQLEDPGDIIVSDVNASPGLAQIYAHGHRDVVVRVWERILEVPFRD